MKKFIFAAVLLSGLLFYCPKVMAQTPYDILPCAGSEAYQVYGEDLQLLAKLVRAEAGNQPLEGKQAVVDVVLNRVDSELFPNTVEEVIFQPGQFSVASNGALNKAEKLLDDSDYRAVITEIHLRMDDDILYFNSGNRCANGEFKYKIGDHYFGTV